MSADNKVVRRGCRPLVDWKAKGARWSISALKTSTGRRTNSAVRKNGDAAISIRMLSWHSQNYATGGQGEVYSTTRASFFHFLVMETKIVIDKLVT